MTSLKHVASVRVSNVDKKSHVGERSVRLCNYTDVYYGNILTSSGNEYMKATASTEQCEQFRLLPGDTVLTKDSETADDIGVSAYIAESAPDFICGYHLAVVRPIKSVIDPKFLFWVLRSLPVRGQMTTSATGVTRFGLRTEALTGVSFDLPSLAEQRRIADFLDDQVARLDRAIELRRRQNVLEDERFLTEVASLYNEAARLAGTVRLGYLLRGLEQGWSPQCEDRHAEADEYGVLKAGCVNGGLFRAEQHKALPASEEPRLQYLVRSGDLLVSRASGSLDLIGSAAVVPPDAPTNLILCDKVYRLRLLPGCDPAFVAVMLRARPIREAIKLGTSGAEGMANNLPSGTVRGLLLPAIDHGRQRAMVQRLLDAETTLVTARALTERSVSLLTERKQALITAAVTGQFDVTVARRVA